VTAKRNITVAGAGIIGLWQALTLARAGHGVTLLEESDEPFANTASRHAGVMLAPDCEGEKAPDVVRNAGHEGLTLWRATYPELINAGSLVLTLPRDQPELVRFERLTTNFERIESVRLADLEPDLAGRFSQALYFPNEAHMAAPAALSFLHHACVAAGASVRFGEKWRPSAAEDLVIDCRGIAAEDDLPNLRSVRGERLLIRTHDIKLCRPVRLLHPRQSIYIVPWEGGQFLLGATEIESSDAGPVTVRSMLELLGAAYALHPAFAEAQVLETGAGLRPAFADNVPRAIVHGSRRISVNGAYRHGFLLAPVLAKAVADYLTSGAGHPLLMKS
jgi:glycine oxidase